ncbi:MAG: hypothetical protein Ct9H300mP17_10200 [Candidatus Nitrosopelagicus sp.]|nr:MAG: hypothetical protein Ct9H300mP17_10200 [Candidatus Nitrosopelagicus sp.]
MEGATEAFKRRRKASSLLTIKDIAESLGFSKN